MLETIHSSNYESDKADELPEKHDCDLPDLTYLNEMAGGDELFVKEIINYFLNNSPALLKLMKESALSGDFEKLYFTVHKLLPQLTFVGIMAAIPDVQRIKNESKQMNDLLEVVDRVIKTINKGTEDLRKMI